MEWNAFYAPQVATLSIYLIIGGVGNFLVILVHVFILKKVKEERYFIPALAITDLLACVLTVMFSVMTDAAAAVQKLRSDTYCKNAYAVGGIPVYFSIFNLFCIAVQRYLKMCKKKRIILHRRRLMVIASLATCIVLPFPLSLTFEMRIFRVANKTFLTECAYAESNIATGYWISISIFLLIIYFSFVYFYGQMGMVLYRHFKNFKCKRFKFSSGHPILNKMSIKSDPMKIKKPPCVKTILTLTNDEYSPELRNIESSYSSSEANQNVEILTVNTSDKTSPDSKLKTSTSNIKTDKTMSVQRAKRIEKIMVKFTFMFIIITSVFLLTTLPLGIVTILVESIPNFWEQLSETEAQAVLWCRRLFIVSYSLNPIIYAFMDTEFRAGVKRLFRSRLCNLSTT